MINDDAVDGLLAVSFVRHLGSIAWSFVEYGSGFKQNWTTLSSIIDATD